MELVATAYPNAIMIHTPIHASWPNQVEIFFSIVQRKVFSPNNFESLGQLESTLRRQLARTATEPTTAATIAA